MTNLLSSWQETLRTSGELTLTIRVRPQAANTCIKGVLEDGSVKIDVAAVPEDNAANEELIRFLAEEFSVHRKSVTIVKGKTGRGKVIKISLPL